MSEVKDMFPVPLDVRVLDDDKHWMVLRRFYCDDPILGRIVMEKGTITDFGSIPPIAKPFINPVGIFREPFAIHDENYSKQNFTRKQADDCLLRGMRAKCQSFEGSLFRKAKNRLDVAMIYSHLRLYGWYAWNQHKKRKEKDKKKA